MTVGGAVWLGIYPREERVTGMRKLLGIPEEVVPMSLIPVGYPVEKNHLLDGLCQKEFTMIPGSNLHRAENSFEAGRSCGKYYLNPVTKTVPNCRIEYPQ